MDTRGHLTQDRTVCHDKAVKGVIAAANLGRDADTLAALIGTLAGARHGASANPAGWIEKTRRQPDVACPLPPRWTW
jgi:ADP-ribosylglycohydrolase